MIFTLDTSHFEMSPSKVAASKNILFISTTLDTSHFEMSPLKDFAPRNKVSILVTLETFHVEISPWKDDASKNILVIIVTLDMSHLEMSPLNATAPANRCFIFVTRDTSHSPISPYILPEQSPCGDNFRHAPTAGLSSAVENTALDVSKALGVVEEMLEMRVVVAIVARTISSRSGNGRRVA